MPENILLGKRFVYIAALIPAMLCVAAYSNTLESPFTFDDYIYVVGNTVIGDGSYFTNPLSYDYAALDPSIRTHYLTRYLGYFSLYANAFAFDGSLAGFHIGSIFIHILNSTLVYLIVLGLFSSPALSSEKASSWAVPVSCLTASLFAAHPIQTGAVAYIAQRFTILASLFYLGAVFAYIRCRLSHSPAMRAVLYALSLMLALSAMLTKEISVTLPLAIGLIEFTFFTNGSRSHRIKRLLPIMLLLLVVPMLLAFNPAKPSGELTKTFNSLPRETYAATEPRVVLTYLRLLILPVNQNLDYDYPLQRSLFSPVPLISIAVIAAIIAAGAILFRLSALKGPYLRLPAFGIFWFFGNLAVESGPIALADVIFEHRVYLPSFGAFLFFASGSGILFSGMQSGIAKKFLTAVIISIPVILCAGAYARNSVWATEISLWEDTVKKSPNKSRAHNSLGVALMEAGRTDEAAGKFMDGIAVDGSCVYCYVNMSRIYRERGDYASAIRHLDYALSVEPDNVGIMTELSFTHEKNGDLAKSWEYQMKISSLDPAGSGIGLMRRHTE